VVLGNVMILRKKFRHCTALSVAFACWFSLSGTVLANPATTNATNAGTLDFAQISKMRLSLRIANDTRKCVLYEEKSANAVQLDIDAPCVFSRSGNDAKKIQMHAYKSVGTVIFVIGKPGLAIDFAKQASVKDSDQCSSQAQAVVVSRNRKISLRPASLNGMFCPNYGLDEKMFYGAAYP
jgi:hypothetical protein